MTDHIRDFHVALTELVDFVEGEPPGKWTMVEFSQLAKEIAEPVYLEQADAQGWKNDFVRACKLFILGYMLGGVNWDPGFVPETSKDAWEGTLSALVKWMQGNLCWSNVETPEPTRTQTKKERMEELRDLLRNHDYLIWQYADQIRIGNFNQNSQRNPRGNTIPPEEWPETWRKEGSPYG